MHKKSHIQCYICLGETPDHVRSRMDDDVDFLILIRF